MKAAFALFTLLASTTTTRSAVNVDNYDYTSAIDTRNADDAALIQLALEAHGSGAFIAARRDGATNASDDDDDNRRMCRSTLTANSAVYKALDQQLTALSGERDLLSRMFGAALVIAIALLAAIPASFYGDQTERVKQHRSLQTFKEQWSAESLALERAAQIDVIDMSHRPQDFSYKYEINDSLGRPIKLGDAPPRAIELDARHRVVRFGRCAFYTHFAFTLLVDTLLTLAVLAASAVPFTSIEPMLELCKLEKRAAKEANCQPLVNARLISHYETTLAWTRAAELQNIILNIMIVFSLFALIIIFQVTFWKATTELNSVERWHQVDTKPSLEPQQTLKYAALRMGKHGDYDVTASTYGIILCAHVGGLIIAAYVAFRTIWALRTGLMVNDGYETCLNKIILQAKMSKQINT